jgi:prephenate dehydrogenase (NADP+)
MTAMEHDSITANTQVLMSTIFMSIVIAFKLQGGLPKSPQLSNREHVTTQIADLYCLVFRIFTQKWHVYAGISLLNPFSESYLTHYATSVRAITAMVMERRFGELLERIKATAAVLNANGLESLRKMTRAQSKASATGALGETISRDATAVEMTLSRLPSILLVAILATGDMWVAHNIDPWEHLHCATPQYRHWLRVVSDIYSYFGSAIMDSTLLALLMDNRQEAVAPDHHLSTAVESCIAHVRDQDYVAFGQSFEETRQWLFRHDSAWAAVKGHIGGGGHDRAPRI